MTSRRFLGIFAFLLLALGVAVVVTVTRMESDLLARTQAAVAAAGIPYYGLRVDGRDVILDGVVGEAVDRQALVEAVAGVTGVRHVRDELLVANGDALPESRQAAPGHDPPVQAGMAPELRLLRVGDRIVATGRLPADGSLRVLERALRDRFPGAELQASVVSNDEVGPRPWTGHLSEVARALELLTDTSTITAYGDVVQVSGGVATEALRSRLDALVDATPEVPWRLVLTRPGGGIGGAG